MIYFFLLLSNHILEQKNAQILNFLNGFKNSKFPELFKITDEKGYFYAESTYRYTKSKIENLIAI